MEIKYIKGLYHAHSTFSYDGKKDLNDIVEWAKNRKFEFVILTEHDFGFTEEKFEKYVVQCRNASEITLIPGIEYSFKCNKGPIHISVFGMDEFVDLDSRPMEIPDFLEYVHGLGGVSVLNHSFRVIGELNYKCFQLFDFIEMWNLVYDVKYAPNNKIIEFSKRKNFQGKFLASSDIHKWLDKNKYPFINVFAKDSGDREKDIIDGLKEGDYSVISKNWTIQPSGAFESNYSLFKKLPEISLKHQLFYENLRKSYYHKFKVAPPKWLVKRIK